MWIITSIFQAIGQAIAWILPISESGHSSIFHVFSSRLTNACSQLTGVIHIGIAVGLILAFYKLFINLFKNFFGTFNDIFHKRLDIKNPSSSRNFMYMTILSFAVYLFYLIPSGRYGNVFSILHRTSYNRILLDEGIWFAMTGVLLITVLSIYDKPKKSLPDFVTALILGVVSFLALPTSGCAYMIILFLFGILLGLSEKTSLRYCVVMSVPTLIVSGIIELVIAVTKINIFSALIGLIVSAAVSFFAVKLLIKLIKSRMLLSFAFYDISIGLICVVIGIFQLISK